MCLSRKLALLAFSILPFNIHSQDLTIPATLNSSYLPAIISQTTQLTYQHSPYIAQQDVTVNAGVSLLVDPNVIVYFYSDAGLYVKGNITISGTADSPVQLLPAPGHDHWEVLSIINGTAPSTLTYTQIRGCTIGDNADRDRAAVSALNCPKIILDHVDIRDVSSCIYYYQTFATCEFRTCYFECNDRGSILFLVRSDMIIDNCEFMGNNGVNSDAIDFDKVTGTISNNYVHDMTGPDSDGIDIGSASEVLLINNSIINCSDSGIESEESSIITVKNNIIAGCSTGITSKQKAKAYFYNNTLDRCDVAFSLYSETNTWNEGGTLEGINNILYRCNTPFDLRDNSTLVLRYNLCNTTLLEGIGNIVGNPLFVDPFDNDYHLQENSPAIDAGDPSFPSDIDGTRADIGAFPFIQTDPGGNLFINEFVAKFGTLLADEYGDYSDWIELFNPNEHAIDIGGWYISDNKDQPTAHMIPRQNPEKTTIPPMGYLILWADGQTTKGPLHLAFQLASSGEDIIISRNTNTVVDQLSYPPQTVDVSYGRYPDGGSEFRFYNIPTPRQPNVTIAPEIISGIFINEFVAKFGTLYPDEHGQYSDWIELYNATNKDVNLGGLYLTDDHQNPAKHQIIPSNSDSALIPAHGFIVFRADDKTNLGWNHVAFELASAGEEIFLYQKVGSVWISIDSVQYPAQTVDVSYGRNGDGGAVWGFFTVPTPNRTNGPASGLYDLPQWRSVVTLYPNPCKDQVSLEISTNTHDRIFIDIFTLSGMKIASIADQNIIQTATGFQSVINSDMLPVMQSDIEIYLIRITMGDSQIFEKLIRRK